MKSEIQIRGSFGELSQFIILTFAFSWLFFVSAALVSGGTLGFKALSTLLIVLGSFGPSLSAFALIMKVGARERLWQLIKSGFDLKFPAAFYLFTAVIPLAVAGLASYLMGGSHVQLSVELPILFIALFFLGGSVGEEFGWRGFVAPRLLSLATPFSSAIILGVIWAFWHLPLFWIGGTSQYSTPFWLYLPYILALSVQYIWIYLRTRGNLFACLLFHTFTNMTVILFPLTERLNTERFGLETFLNGLIALTLLFFEKRLFFSEFSGFVPSP